MNSISSLFASIIAVILLTVVPAYRMNFIAEQSIFNHVNLVTEEFTNNCRYKGYIDDKMLYDFNSELSKTNMMYDISITHMKKVYYPVEEEGEMYFDTYDEAHTSKEIYDEIKGEGKYLMNKGDTISVQVKNSSSLASFTLSSIMTQTDTDIFATNGGIITNEDY